jgi:hypothetical protein
LAYAGLDLSADELKDAVDPAYSLEEMRLHEAPLKYGRKPRSR